MIEDEADEHTLASARVEGGEGPAHFTPTEVRREARLAKEAEEAALAHRPVSAHVAVQVAAQCVAVLVARPPLAHRSR